MPLLFASTLYCSQVSGMNWDGPTAPVRLTVLPVMTSSRQADSASTCAAKYDGSRSYLAADAMTQKAHSTRGTSATSKFGNRAISADISAAISGAGNGANSGAGAGAAGLSTSGTGNGGGSGAWINSVSGSVSATANTVSNCIGDEVAGGGAAAWGRGVMFPLSAKIVAESPAPGFDGVWGTGNGGGSGAGAGSGAGGGGGGAGASMVGGPFGLITAMAILAGPKTPLGSWGSSVNLRLFGSANSSLPSGVIPRIAKI